MKNLCLLTQTLNHIYVVGCGLSSHSAIFQLYEYSDETVVQFPNLDLLPGTKRHGQLGVFSVLNLPRQTTYFTFLPSDGANAVRVCRESNPDRPIHSPACYLYATAADQSTYITMKDKEKLLDSIFLISRGKF